MVMKKKPSSKLRKKIDVAAGDVLLVPQSNGRYSIAYVLGLWPELESVMTIALLLADVGENQKTEWELGPFVTSEIARLALFAVVSTPVVPGKNGEWPKIGAVTGIDVGDLLPQIPYKTGSIVGGKYLSSTMVEGLVEAYRGLSDWDSLLPGRPGYLKSLLFFESHNKEGCSD